MSDPKNNRGEVPVGLGMALAQNMKAMDKFSGLDGKQKDAVLKKAGEVNTKNEMQSMVQRLAEEELPGVLGTVSSNEVTGMMPTPPSDEDELESYKQMFSSEVP